MSKKMTPCEKLGYKVGDEFTVIEESYKFNVGDVISLQRDDGTGIPFFTNKSVSMGHPGGVACFLSSLKKIAKLKPAKQALADAIHQNGGWPKECHWMFATSNGFGGAFCWTNKPKRSGWNWLGGGKFTLCCEIGASIPNWHQCILSRDEYFTAYPEQVNVVVKNETEHKVEVEMKSESEVTIKVGDWYKNGELPPVGVVCEVYSDRPHHSYKHHVCLSVRIVAHDGDVAVYFVESLQEYYALVARCFRPLRTERDKAIDEMVSSVLAVMNSDLQRRLCEDLYDAGYRKEVK